MFEFGKIDKLDFKVEMSLLVQGYLASGSCLSEFLHTKPRVFFVDYPDFY